MGCSRHSQIFLNAAWNARGFEITACFCQLSFDFHTANLPTYQLYRITEEGSTLTYSHSPFGYRNRYKQIMDGTPIEQFDSTTRSQTYSAKMCFRMRIGSWGAA